MTQADRQPIARFKMAEMTPQEAATFIRNIAETVVGTEGWENFERIVESMIVSAMDAGREGA